MAEPIIVNPDDFSEPDEDLKVRFRSAVEANKSVGRILLGASALTLGIDNQGNDFELHSATIETPLKGTDGLECIFTEYSVTKDGRARRLISSMPFTDYILSILPEIAAQMTDPEAIEQYTALAEQPVRLDPTEVTDWLNGLTLVNPLATLGQAMELAEDEGNSPANMLTAGELGDIIQTIELAHGGHRG